MHLYFLCPSLFRHTLRPSVTPLEGSWGRPGDGVGVGLTEQNLLCWGDQVSFLHRRGGRGGEDSSSSFRISVFSRSCYRGFSGSYSVFLTEHYSLFQGNSPQTLLMFFKG